MKTTTSRARDKSFLTTCLKCGDNLCKRNVVLAILFCWLLLFYLFSNVTEENLLSEPRKTTDESQLQQSPLNRKSSNVRWVNPAPFWSLYNFSSVPSSNSNDNSSNSNDGNDNINNSDDGNASEAQSPTTTATTLTPTTTTTSTASSELSPVPGLGKTTKTILFFTSYFHVVDFQFGFGQQPFFDHKCPVTNCYTTNNRSLLGSLEDFDAMVFHVRDMNDGHIPLPNQRRRKPNQRYVMFLMESPLNDNFPYEKFGGFFNWTMTYRWDSDFVRPYAWVEPNTATDSHAPTATQPYDLSYPRGNDTFLRAFGDEVARSKSSAPTIAWLVSNCGTHSERENFVEQLQNFVQVDVYGECGPLKCSRSDEDGCMKMLEAKYKFYLSFENSFCEDYVTEKFFKVLNYNIIPIVLGGGNYSKMAPKKSYIDSKDFRSIADLAEHIKHLDRNATAYAEYFEWKDHFRVVMDYTNVFCQLCQALNDPDSPAKSYDDIYKWWRTGGKCIKKGRFPWSKTTLEHYVDFFKEGASQIVSLIGTNKGLL